MFFQDKPPSYDVNLPYTAPTKDQNCSTRYPEYLPTWDKVFFDPLPPFHFEDPASRVKDITLPHLLAEGTKVTHIQPKFGTIVERVQLGDLTSSGKDELAYLLSSRKVLVFPDQDLVDAGFEKQSEFMRHFGKLNFQPVSGSVRGHPQFHIIHREGNKKEIDDFLAHKTTTTLWHQDVSYESQPPGYVMLGLLEGPSVGGDTVFAATDEAYKRLSPILCSFLDGLQAVHSSRNMIAHARAMGGLVRKDPIDTVHPLVRVHPVTNQRCLFLNTEFITRISGTKESETRMLLDFLMQHIISGHDFQARVKWSPRTIVMFDNRSTIHTAVVDYVDEERGAELRHIFRLCAMAEKPISVKDFDMSLTDELSAKKDQYEMKL